MANNFLFILVTILLDQKLTKKKSRTSYHGSPLYALLQANCESDASFFDKFWQQSIHVLAELRGFRKKRKSFF